MPKNRLDAEVPGANENAAPPDYKRACNEFNAHSAEKDLALSPITCVT